MNCTIKPQVLVDGVVFENTHQVGIWRVFYEVMKRTSGDVDYKLLLSHPPLQDVPDGIEIHQIRHRMECHRFNAYKQSRKRAAAEAIRKRFPMSIWHSTFFTPDPRKDKPSVVSVYDMLAERFFLQTPGLERQIQSKKTAVSDANAIVAISHHTANEITRFYTGISVPIHVAQLGVEHLTSNSTKKDRTTDPRSGCLFVGGRKSYKNFATLVEAVATQEWPRELHIRVTGQPFSQNERRLLVYHNVEERFEHLGFVSDSALQKLYAESICFVFPSLGEGFGLPTLEAQANGCLPIVSDLPVFHEVAGKGAVYFDPRCTRSLARAAKLACNTKKCEDILAAGTNNVEHFSWDKTAAATLKCYLDLWNKP